MRETAVARMSCAEVSVEEKLKEGGGRAMAIEEY